MPHPAAAVNHRIFVGATYSSYSANDAPSSAAAEICHPSLRPLRCQWLSGVQPIQAGVLARVEFLAFQRGMVVAVTVGAEHRVGVARQ